MTRIMRETVAKLIEAADESERVFGLRNQVVIAEIYGKKRNRPELSNSFANSTGRWSGVSTTPTKRAPFSGCLSNGIRNAGHGF
jgi:hypothetical protein